MLSSKIPISLFEDGRFGNIHARFGAKGFGAVVQTVLCLAHKDYRIELYSGTEELMAQSFGVSLGLLLDIIAYGEKLGLFLVLEEGTSFYLTCPILQIPASKTDENKTDLHTPCLKSPKNQKNSSDIGQNLISEGYADSAHSGKKEKKKQKKKEDNINNNLLNKLPYGESKVVYLTEAEHEKLVKKFGVDGTRRWIEKLENYAGVFPERFKKYASHYHVILTWARGEAEKDAAPTKQTSGYNNIRSLN